MGHHSISTRSLRHLPRKLRMTDSSSVFHAWKTGRTIHTISELFHRTTRRTCDTHSIWSAPDSLTKWRRLLFELAGHGSLRVILVQLLYGNAKNGGKLATLGASFRHYRVPDRHVSGPEVPLPDLI